jgi:hypothetical protein
MAFRKYIPVHPPVVAVPGSGLCGGLRFAVDSVESLADRRHQSIGFNSHSYLTVRAWRSVGAPDKTAAATMPVGSLPSITRLGTGEKVLREDKSTEIRSYGAVALTTCHGPRSHCSPADGVPLPPRESPSASRRSSASGPSAAHRVMSLVALHRVGKRMIGRNIVEGRPMAAFPPACRPPLGIGDYLALALTLWHDRQ